MKSATALLALVLTVVLPVAAAAQGLTRLRPGAGTPAQEAVAGQVIVQFEAGVSAAARGTVRQDADVDVVKAMQRPGQQLLAVQAGQSVDDAIRDLQRDPRVAYAQKNYVYTATAVPNDPLFGQLWGMRNVGQAIHGNPGVVGTPGVDIDAPLAWDRTTGSNNIVVAVADSGVAYDHPDLDGNIWINDDPLNGADDDGNGFVDDLIGWDFSPGSNDNDPYDLNEHGTHVAGTIGAEGNNGVSVAGVNWSVSLMPVRVLNAAGSGTSQTVADGFNYAGNNGARVVNASLGGPRGQQDTVVFDAVAAHRNTLYVVSAGNGGADGIGDDNDAVGLAQSPCNLENANLVCVAATTPTDQRASFSNFGATSVDLGAPGTDILSTVPAFVFSEDFEAGLGKWAATSWTLTSATSGGGSFSMADSTGNYATNANAILQTSAAVPNSSGCPLTFDIRMQTPDTGDRLFVEVSTNGMTWTSLGSISGDFGSSFFPISAGTLPANDFIRFRFTADGDGTVGDGVYVDNVKVGCVDGAATPTGSDVAFLDGTSMASPQVAGAAALALSLKPSATPADLKSALMSTGDPDPALAGITVSGRRLNVLNLLNTISPPTQTTPPANPVPTVPPVVTPPAPKTLASVKVDRCKQSGRGRTLQLKCRLRDSDALRSSTARIKKGRRTVATGKVKLSKGSLSVKLKRKLRKGRYTLTLALRGTGGTKRTLNIKFRI